MVKLVEKSSSAVSLASAALLVVSVSYDFATLDGLSLSFAQVPTTLADHVRSAVFWVPTVGSAVLLGAATGTSLPPGGSISTASKATPAQRVVLVLLLCTAFVLLLQALLFRTSVEFLVVAITIVTACMAYRIVLRMGQGRSPGFWLAIGAVSVALCSGLAAYAGYAESRALKESRRSEWTVQLKEGGELAGKHRLQGLRQFEKVSVLVKRSDLIYVVPTADIQWTSRDTVKLPSLACQFSTTLCFDDH